MKLTDLFSENEILNSKGNISEISVTDVTANSDDVGPGSVFVCIDGMHTDSHTLIPECIRRGAAAVVISNAGAASGCTVPFILVENTRKTFSSMLYRFFGRPADEMKVIAVTGTNGKTSVTYMLRAILEKAGFKVGIIGTVKNYIGGRTVDGAGLTTPDPAELYRLLFLMKEEDCDFVLMEASSHSLYLDKVSAIPVDTAIFTNLTPDHLDFHKDMDSYCAAKQKLFRQSRISVVNADSPYGDAMADVAAERIYKYGIDAENADFRARDVKICGPHGLGYRLCAWGDEFYISSKIPGRFSVYNTMAAASVAYLYGVGADIIGKALFEMNGVEGRMQRVPLETVATDPKYSKISLFIDFAHTPDALENVLLTAQGFRTKGDRIVAVFGCGGDRDRSKRPLMGKIASRLADYIIITQDNSRSEDPLDIIGEILGGFDNSKPHTVILDRRSAIEFALANARSGDIILLCGKGHENYQIDKDGKRYFSEYETAMNFVAGSGPVKN